MFFPGRGPVKKNKHMDCAMEPLNGAVFLSRMITEVFCKAFVCGVRTDSHRHAAPFFIPVLSAPGRRKGQEDEKAERFRVRSLDHRGRQVHGAGAAH